MTQDPPTRGFAVHPSTMDQQQHQPQPTTIRTAQEEEEEEEEYRTLWMENLQNWMDKVEEKEVRTLWIGDLQHWMDEAYIDSCFSHTGEVFTSKVIHKKKKITTGESKCYGFIEFKSHAIAEGILHKFNGTPMPRAGTNFTLTWSSSFGGSGEGEDDDDDDDDDLAADDFTISLVGDDDDDLAAAAAACDTRFMLPKEAFPSIKPMDPNRLTFRRISIDEANSSWEDTLKWRSIAQGTRSPREVYALHRVYVIGAFLGISGSSFVEEGVSPEIIIQEMLDELPRYVDCIDIAKELHSIGALKPLLFKFYCQHDGIREKTAKVINTMAKNHPSSRHLIMEADNSGLLYQVYMEGNPLVETNVLDAIYSLFWNNKPGIALFRESYHFEFLRHGMETDLVDFQRRSLNLIFCLLHASNSECNTIIELGYHRNMIHLASSDDADVRKAALRCLLVLVLVVEDENSAQLVKNDDKLQKRMEEVITAMAPEDLGAADEEKRLVVSLWNPEDLGAADEEKKLVVSLWDACYNNKQLLLLAPVSDVVQAI